MMWYLALRSTMLTAAKDNGQKSSRTVLPAHSLPSSTYRFSLVHCKYHVSLTSTSTHTRTHTQDTVYHTRRCATRTVAKQDCRASSVRSAATTSFAWSPTRWTWRQPGSASAAGQARRAGSRWAPAALGRQRAGRSSSWRPPSSTARRAPRRRRFFSALTAGTASRLQVCSQWLIILHSINNFSNITYFPVRMNRNRHSNSGCKGCKRLVRFNLSYYL